MRSLLLAALLASAAWFTYRGVGKNQYVLLDDDLHITNNPYLSEPKGVWGIWREPYQGLYIPVTYTFWAAEKAVFERYWGTWQSGPPARESQAKFFHWVNWLIHVGNTLLVFFVLLELVGVRWAAFAGALLFCVHPVQVEPVAWVSGLKDVLSGFFCLVSILSYLRFSRLRLTSNPKANWAYATAALAFGLALLSKPSSVVVPAILFFLSILGQKAPLRATALRLIPWILAAATVGWLTKASQPNDHITFIAPWAIRPLIASDALTFYFSKVIFPVNLAPDYGRNPALFLHSHWKWVTWLVPILLALVLWKRSRQTQAAFVVFLVSLFPVLGFVPFYFQEFSTVADRYLYLAMLGPAFLLARETSRRTSKFIVGCAALLLIVLCLTARLQANHWRDSTALFRHTIRVNPNSVLAHNNLGTLLENKETWLEAAYHYKEVIRIDPDNLAGHYNFGRLLARLGRYDLAEPEFQRVLQKETAIPDAQYGLGMVYLRTHQLEKAKSHLFLALKYRPGHPMTLAQIGNVFRESKDCKEALRYFDASLQRDPELAEGNFGKGQCLVTTGHRAQAASYFEKAARREPEWDAPRKASVALRAMKSNSQAKAP